jgi:hypothetical protein
MEKIELNVDREVYEGSVVVTFDKRDTEIDDVVAVGGYVQIRQGSNSFQVFVFNSDGDVVSNTTVPFDFKSVEEL